MMLGIYAPISAQDGELAQIYIQDGWRKSNDGYWHSKHEGKTYWYKRDDTGNLSRSLDGKSWKKVDDNMWVDNDGRWVRITDNTLMWSEDRGKLWVPVPDRKWRGNDGQVYKFDGSWTVWSRERLE